MNLICKFSVCFFTVLLSTAVVGISYATKDNRDHGHKSEKKHEPHSAGKNHKEAPGGHGHKEEPGGHGEESTVTIKPESIRAQGIIVKAVVPRALGDVLSSP